MDISYWVRYLTTACFIFFYAHNGYTTDVLSYADFLERVRINHPKAKQIALLKQKAELKLRAAKAVWMPKLEGSFDRKSFGQRNYFTIADGKMKIPTTWGMDFSVGYSYAQGYYLNAERTLPDVGQAYIGISMPLLEGFLQNDRRIGILKAEMGLAIAQLETQLQTNELYYKAAKAYLEWATAFEQQQLLQQTIDLMYTQLQGVRESYEGGAVAAIDTLKIYIQIQNFEAQWTEASLEYLQKRQKMTNYMWANDSSVMDMTAFEPMRLAVLGEELNVLYQQNGSNDITQHPLLRLLNYNLETLELDERLRKNQMLPKLNFKYNMLAYEHVDFFGAYPGENYKFGTTLSMPLFPQKEQAYLKLNQLDQQKIIFQQPAQLQELQTLYDNALLAIENTSQQLIIYSDMVENYTILLEMEYEKYRLGASDLLMINLLESQRVQAQLKLLKAQKKQSKALLDKAWALAELGK